MSASRGRAMRRKNTQRIKNKLRRKEKLHPFWTAKFNYNYDELIDSAAGLYANHGCNCSCSMCGNPRRYFGELTLQERRAENASSLQEE